MGRLTLSTFQKNNTTSVSNVFLDKYMRDANGEFVKVYLYLLRCMCGSFSNTDISLSDIADKLNLTEKDVIRALKYWTKADILNVVFNPSTGEPESVTILSLDSDNNSAAALSIPFGEAAPANIYDKQISPDKAGYVADTASEEISSETAKRNVPSSVSYPAARIKRFKEQEETKQLLYIVEKYIGKTLTSSDINKILYIHEELKFSPDIIEYLVEYCVSNQHSSMYYIEKVALEWHNKGIRTLEEAKDISTLYSRRNNPVRRAFGISDRNLSSVEIDFINRWYDEYGFDSEIITEACQQTILSIGKPNFRYADRILCKWKSANVHTAADIQKLKDGFKGRLTVPVNGKPGQPPVKSNRFNNFSQRTYDFEDIEKKLIGSSK